MRDITQIVDRYREVVRHLWNAGLWSDPDAQTDPELSEVFEEIAATLFEVLVLWKIGLRGISLRPVNVGPTEPLSFLHVDLGAGSRIMINRGDHSPYWDHPIVAAANAELDLRFINFFHWEPAAFREYGLYRTRIVASARYPEVVGRDALVPVNSGVGILFVPNPESAT